MECLGMSIGLPLDVLDEIWDLIESVSEGFLTFSPVDAPQSAWKQLFSMLPSYRFMDQQLDMMTMRSSNSTINSRKS